MAISNLHPPYAFASIALTIPEEPARAPFFEVIYGAGGEPVDPSPPHWSPDESTLTFAYQWQRAALNIAGDEVAVPTGDGRWGNVDGATGAKLTIPADGANYDYRVLVTATDPATSDTLTVTSKSWGDWQVDNSIAAVPLLQDRFPWLNPSGAFSGGHITVISDWRFTPTSVSVQWQVSTDHGASWSNDGSPAAASLSTLGSGDVQASADHTIPGSSDGKAYRALVTATNANGDSSQATSNAVVIAPYSDTAPSKGPDSYGALDTQPYLTIGNETTTDGGQVSPKIDDVLYCWAAGKWQGAALGDDASLTLAYQWQRDGADIAGETSQSYTVVAADSGHVLSCLVRATDASSISSLWYSSVDSAEVAGYSDPGFVDDGSGNPSAVGVGTVLNAPTPSWGFTVTVGPTYQWQRSSDGGATWTDISGETASTYTTVDADGGCLVRCKVEAS